MSGIAEKADAPSSSVRRERWLALARLIIATATVGSFALVVYSRRPRQLPADVDVIGYPTYANWNFAPSILAYRLVTFVVPLGIAALYLAMSWRGPLRRSTGSSTGCDLVAVAAGPDHSPAHSLTTPGVWFRLIVPAAVVWIAVTSTARSLSVGPRLLGIGAAVLYVIGALVCSVLLSRRASGADRRSRFIDVLAWTNAIGGSCASVIGLFLVSHRASVVVSADNSVRSAAWLPWWVVIAAVLIIGSAALRLVRRRVAARLVEAKMLALVVGPILLFLIVSRMPGAMGPFQGFDDAQELSGASLLADGFFPWRDLLFIHGLYEDVLRGSLGFALFEPSRWGVAAAMSVVIGPLGWVLMYLLAVWAGRGHRWTGVVLGVLVVSGALNPLNGRFVLVPAVLILFGETLVRRSTRWCAALMMVLFSTAVLVPEMVGLVLAGVPAIVIADVVQRRHGDRWRDVLWRTRWCAAFGVGLVAIWCGFLAINGALRGFIDYYLVFGPGHTASGAIPPQQITRFHWFEFRLGPVLVAATVWAVVVWFRRQRVWAAQDFAMIAAAGFAAMYGEKALGRFDAGHVDQVFTITLPLAILWAGVLLNAADRRVTFTVQAGRQPWSVRQPITVLTALVLSFVLPSGYSAAADAPTNPHSEVPERALSESLGYTQAGAINLALLDDLDSVFRTYAGVDEPIFDMTSSPGYIYFLLDRHPGTRFYHVDMAITEYSQELLIDELTVSRPKLVLFDSTTIGLPEWDYIAGQIRHYDVSQFILDGWTPLVETNGVLVFLRNDLVADAPPLPELSQATTADLWFESNPCDWGAIPNFVRPIASGEVLELGINWRDATSITSSGWAVDPLTGGPPRTFVLVSETGIVPAVSSPVERIDVVATAGPAAQYSGFSLGATVDSTTPPAGMVILALTSDGALHPFGPQPFPRLPSAVTLPDGTVAEVGASIDGWVDALDATQLLSGVVELPVGLDLTDYQMATFVADGGLGAARISIADQPNIVSHVIVANSLDSSDEPFSIRVGSCMQWHGYRSHRLFVSQIGGTTAEKIVLSEVAD